MKFASIVGARPQFVKLAAVSRELRKRHQELIIHTGQHYDYALSAQFFGELAIPEPDYHLEAGSGTHGAQTARMLESIERVLQQEQPDWVVLYGDTNSTLAGALAAAKLSLPIAHVEAGLRSFNRSMPEEINRVLTDHLAERLFCPTETARENALREGITSGVEVVGDVMYDILLQALPRIDEQTQACTAELDIRARYYALVTVHRAANTDDPAAMQNIANALNKLEIPVIFPAHPRTRACLQRYAIPLREHVRLIEPVGYLTMLALERGAYRILTDSGGVQKEAFLLGVPCITLRAETEWVETVQSGWNQLSGTQPPAILHAFEQPEPATARPPLFGDGKAALRIAQSW